MAKNITAAALAVVVGLLFFLGNMLGWNWLWFLFLAGVFATASLGALIAYAFNDRAALIGGIAGAFTFMVFYGIAYAAGLSTLIVIGLLLAEIAAVAAYACFLVPRRRNWQDWDLPHDPPKDKEVVVDRPEADPPRRDTRPLGRDDEI